MGRTARVPGVSECACPPAAQRLAAAVNPHPLDARYHDGTIGAPGYVTEDRVMARALDLVMKISRRLSRALMAGAVICSPSLAFAQDTVLFFGGVQSCTVWQSSPRNQLAGQTWILGFFSGHNYAKAHKVGQSTNASGIIGEVKKICTAQPTMRLRDATKEAYGNIWDREAKSH
jgi:hypothetical protein